jgi:hypothetical protein
MGADLCGFILVGPMELDAKKVEEAKAWFDRLKDQAENENDDEAPDLKALLANEWAVEAIGGGDQEGAIEAILGYDENFVAQLCDFWTAGGYRDAMARELDGNRKIVVAGERTYGDGPEPGSAWWLCGQADALGLLERLGIE